MKLKKDFLGKQTKYKILAILFLISLISSSVLAFFPIDSICSPTSGCAVVYKSGYSSLLFGIDNSRLGFIAFLALLTITLSQIINPKKEKEFAITLGITASGLIALYFIYLQAFIIGAFCKYCMVVDIGCIISLGVFIYYKFKE